MILVEMMEWDRVTPDQNPILADRSLIDRVLANPVVELLRDRLNISHIRDGLEIVSTSFVGRIDVDQLRIAIRPKLPMMPLACLVRYAYGLRDLTTLEETHAPTTIHGLHDLLIAMLIAEAEELLHRGLARKYVPLRDKLECPRGRILVEELAGEGGIKEARLPCRYFERHVNWHLNEVLRAANYENDQTINAEKFWLGAL